MHCLLFKFAVVFYIAVYSYSLARQTLKKGLVKRPMWFCVAEFAELTTHCTDSPIRHEWQHLYTIVSMPIQRSDD